MTTPSNYRHITVDPDTKALSVVESVLPAPRGRDLTIEIAGAGLNRADLLQRQGLYPAPADASPILGLEVSGIVVARGSSVTQYEIGDRVCALVHGGGYASHCNIREDQCIRVPERIDLVDAAGLPEALLTAWLNVFERARLQASETLLMQGGSSGIGSIAVQMARLWGAKTIATAGGSEKCEQLVNLGVDRAIDYRTEDFVEAVTEFTQGQGANVIFDMVGGDYIQKHIQCAAVEGRIANIAYQNGFEANIHFGLVLIKRLTLSASTLRPQSFDHKAAMLGEIQKHFGQALASGDLAPVIDSYFSLEEAATAQDYMASGKHFGKILLRP
jgi:putative PIG3 family NAD(P)H quinone oxidoreductase